MAARLDDKTAPANRRRQDGSRHSAEVTLSSPIAARSCRALGTFPLSLPAWPGILFRVGAQRALVTLSSLDFRHMLGAVKLGSQARLGPSRRRWHLPGPPHDAAVRSGQSASSGAASLPGRTVHVAPSGARAAQSLPRVQQLASMHSDTSFPSPPAWCASPFRLRNKRPRSAPR